MDRFNLVMGFLGGILLLYVALPVAGTALRVGPDEFLKAVSRPALISSLALSLATATAATSIIALFGIPLGYVVSRSGRRLSQLLTVVATVPLVIPPLIGGAMLLNVLGVSSLVGSVADSVGLRLSQSPLGIILAQVFVASPFVILTSSSAFDRVDRSYEFVSRTLGRGQGSTFVRITLPLAARGIAAGLVLAWVRAVGELGATMMMAYNPKTVSVQLWEENAIGGLSAVLPGVLLVILISFSLLLLWVWLSSLERSGGWLGA